MPTTHYLVVVTDPRGNPYPGARVTLQGQALPQTTNADGVAAFPAVSPGQVIANVQVGDLKVNGAGSADATLFVTVPVCAPGPFLSNTEIIALIGGGAMTFGGLKWKSPGIQTVGEIFLGAAVFSCLYRASCRW
jgi:hypothetical protein